MYNTILSVIVPVYNGEKWLERAINSLVFQPCGDRLEIIAVNDGSKDNSANLLDSLAQKYSNLKVIHKENGGVSSARNLAIKEAKSKYIAFLDCDDWWAKDFFDEKLIEVLEEDFDIYQFGYTHISEELNWKEYRPVIEGEWRYDKNERGRYDYEHFCSFIYKSEIFERENINFFLIKLNEDRPVPDRFLFVSKSFKRVNKNIFYYWSNGHSATHLTNYDQFFNQNYLSFLYLKEWLARYQVEYSLDYDVLMLFRNILKDVCACNSFKETVRYFEDDVRFNIVKEYENVPNLTPSLKKALKDWNKKPKRVWLKAKLFYKPKVKLKNLMKKTKFIRKMADYWFYKKRGYVKAQKDDVWTQYLEK